MKETGLDEFNAGGVPLPQLLQRAALKQGALPTGKDLVYSFNALLIRDPA